MNLKRNYIIVLILLIQLVIPAQTSSNYTRFGVGEIVYSYSARNLGLGGLGVSVANGNYISLINPASLTKIELTRVEFGANLNGLFLSDNSNSGFYSSGGFDGISLAFPVSTANGITLSMGLLPFSNVNYLNVETTNPSSDISERFVTTYEGSGSLSKLFLGTSLKLPFDLSLGVTMDYYFGNITYFSRIEFTNNVSMRSSEFNNKRRPGGFGSTIGIITPDIAKLFSSNTLSDFRLGFSVNLFSDLSTDTLLIRTSVLGIDTLSNENVNMHLPTRIFAGMSFIVNKEYLFTFDYTAQKWTNYTFNGLKSSNLQDSYRYSIGIEHDNQNKRSVFNKEHMVWRLGVSYEKTLYEFNGEGINHLAFYTGLSLPLSLKNSLDFGLEYSIRGTTSSNLIKEKRIKFSVGFSLGELWFVRRR
ncbi:MAG: hypothetical protein IIA48_02925 [Bacteroidetes bacterium]|nr:hypothetical protein [Bacteroidota bacterium]